MVSTEKVKRVGNIITGLQQSKHNLVLFRDSPELWFQYYLGLYFEMPTLIILQNKDKKFVKRLQHPLVLKFFFIDEFTEKTAQELATEIAEFLA